MLRQNFNADWSIVKGGAGLLAAMSGNGPKPEPVHLPHDAMIHETPDPNDPSGAQTGFYPGGAYEYQKTLEAPAEWEGKDIVLEFEGVYQIAKVYVNGSHAATNLSGYSGFYVPIGALLHYGEANEIKVVANNPTPNSRWYCGSGIYRDVKLMVGGDVHIELDGVRATTRLANEKEAIVEIETRMVNITRKKQPVFVKTALSFDGVVVKEDQVQVTLFSEDKETVRQNLRIIEPKLWNIDTPNLYDVKVEILRGEEVLDEDCFKTGLRTLTLDAEEGLRINGISIKQKGTCIHHDNGVIGTATFAAAEDRRARQMKEAGFNAVRSAHHPMSKAMLNACDQYGLVVMDELSDMWYQEKNRNDYSAFFDVCWEEDIRRIVAKDYNHPCVILYSTGNEITDLGHELGAKINRKLCNKFHELDSTRFTTTAVNGLINVIQAGKMQAIMMDVMAKMGIDPAVLAQPKEEDSEEKNTGIGLLNMFMGAMNSDDFATHPVMTACLEEPAQAADIAGYNYLTGRHGDTEKLLHPNKPVLGTETYPGDIVRLWRVVEDNPHVLGDYTWTGYDYLGEAGCGIFYYDGNVNFSSHFPDRLAYIGDIDLIGSRRPISYLRETVFGDRKAPYLAVIRVDKYGKEHSQTAWMYKDNVSCWTWPGFEGQKTDVEIYSVDPEVELFLNGVSLGKKPCGRDNGFTAVYEGVVYEPGTLEAVSYRDGAETGRYVLKTAAAETVLSVEADRPEVKADGEDLIYATLSLTDAAGILKMAEQREVTVSIVGPGELQGFGSADPQPTNGYQDTTWPTFDGKVMAVVRPTGAPGTVKITFASEGLESASVCVECR